MFSSHAGNLIFAASGSVEAPTSVISVPSQVSNASSASAALATSVKAVSAQFFSPSAAMSNATSSNINAAAAASALTTGVVSAFDSPCYVTAAGPTVVNAKTNATFYVGGYSAMEKNDHIYDDMLDGADEESDNDDNADDADENENKKKKSNKKSKVNQHLAVVVVKGHRTAALSPCKNYIYVLRTDTFALDWAVDVSAIPSAAGKNAAAAAPAAVAQISLIDAHRLVVVLANGEMFFATRPLGAEEGTTFHEEDGKTFDNNVNRKPSSDKFRYFVTRVLTPIAVTGITAAAHGVVSSILPLKAVFSAKAKTLAVDFFVVVAKNGTTNKFALTTGKITVALESAAAIAMSVVAPTEANAITTASVPTGFAVSAPTAVEAEASTGKKKGGKKSSSADLAMTLLVVPTGVVAAATDSVTIGYLAALAKDNAAVVSTTAVKTQTASLNTAAAGFVAVTAGELLNDNMLAVGIAVGEGSAPIPTTASTGAASAASSPLRKSGGGAKALDTSSSAPLALTGTSVGKVVYGTFYYEQEEDRSCGASIDTSIINLTDESSVAAASSSSAFENSASVLAPVGFFYNAKLSQHTVVASSATVATGASALSLVGISLLSGFPSNGSTIAQSSWVAVKSVLSAAANSSSNSAAADGEDRYSAGGKNGGADAKNFVTLNYPIVTLSENASSSSSLSAAAGSASSSPAAAASASSSKKSNNSDPYRINASRIYGRASITAPVTVHARTLAQWPNAVIGVLKMLVDYTSVAMAASAANANSSSNGSAANTASAAAVISASVLSMFKRLAETASAFIPTALTGKKGAAGASAFEVSIITHAFHPSAIRNALRRLPFAVAAAASAAASASSAKSAVVPSISTNELVNGLFAALLDGVDASSSTLVVAAASSSSSATQQQQIQIADSFLRSAVGALEICHHLITLQTQLGASLQGVIVSRYVLLLRSLRSLGDECDQIAGRLGATLDRQRITAVYASSLADEKAKIKDYQEGAAAEEGGAAAEKKKDGGNSAVAQQKVNFAKADVRRKIASVGTGNVADNLSVQLENNKKILDLVDAKLAAKLKAKQGSDNNAGAAVPLYASAGMRSLKSDFQDHYERYLLLGERK